MRQEVQVYVTIKGLNQTFEESGGGDRPMGFVVITIKISATDRYGRPQDNGP